MKAIRLAASAALALAVACAGTDPSSSSGDVNVKVDAATSRYAISRISLDVQPANVQQDLTYDEATGTFSGSVRLPAGVQNFTATAWALDVVVGTGSVATEILPNQTALIGIWIYDTTPPEDVPDHGPVIIAMAVPRTALDVGQPASLAAYAVDPDGEPVSFQWTTDCLDSSFSRPNDAGTEWWSWRPGTCVITLVVGSNGLFDTESFAMYVRPSEGDALVEGYFVERPVITSMSIVLADTPFTCTVERTGSNATCDAVAYPSQYTNVEIRFEGGDVKEPVQVDLWDDCGGHGFPLEHGEGRALFGWEAPPSRGACMVSARVASAGLDDVFPVALAIATCKDDDYEPNDYLSAATWISDKNTYVNVYANDDDWFRFDAVESAPWLIQASAGERVGIEVLAADGATVLASGMGGVGFPTIAGATYFVRVFSLTPDVCSSPYDLSIGRGCWDPSLCGWPL